MTLQAAPACGSGVAGRQWCCELGTILWLQLQRCVQDVLQGLQENNGVMGAACAACGGVRLLGRGQSSREQCAESERVSVLCVYDF